MRNNKKAEPLSPALRFRFIGKSINFFSPANCGQTGNSCTEEACKKKQQKKQGDCQRNMGN